MKNFPSSYPTDHHGLKAESRQYALPVRDQTVSYRRKQITQWNRSGMMLLQMKNEKQQICDLMVDLTEHEMIATDDTQPRKLDISFVLLLETQENEVPVMMSLDNMKLQKLNDDTNQLGSGMMQLIDNPDRSANDAFN